MKLAEINPRKLADAAHDEALGELTMRAMNLGVTAPIAPDITPSEVWLSVHQLAHYATTGEPPEHRPELIAEYQLSVATYRDYLHEGSETQRAVDLVLRASVARESLARDEAISHTDLAALAGLSKSHLTALVQSGDAPEPAYEVVPGTARTYQYDADACREWLRGRGVMGL